MGKMTLISGVILFFCAGCDNSPKPPTPQEIQALTEATFTSAKIDVQSSDAKITFANPNDPHFKAILNALLPIQTIETGNLFGFDYTILCYQQSKPIVIWVKVHDDHLKYRFANGIYTGGDSDAFRTLINQKLNLIDPTLTVTTR
jgi:hypothetical protein